MRYSMWQDTNPKRTAAQKLGDALAAFREKYQREPTEILINPATAADGGEIPTRALAQVPVNGFWLGLGGE